MARPPRDYARQFQAASGPDIFYRTAQEATVDLFKSLYTAVELVADHKLARPLGANAAGARPRQAELWRSNQSAAVITANLEAARDLYAAAFGPFVPDKGLDAELRKRFEDAVRAAKEVRLESAVGDAGQRPRVEKLKADCARLKALIAQKLAPALGIPLGFNALDGD